MKKNKQLTAEVPYVVYKKFEEKSDETRKSMAHYIRQAVYEYIHRNPEIEVEGTLKKVIENTDMFDDAITEKTYREMVNTAVEEEMKSATFVELMDENLARVYISLNGYEVGKERIAKRMKMVLDKMEQRAEHHGYKDLWQYRYEEPVQYAEEYLERKSVEREALEDTGLI